MSSRLSKPLKADKAVTASAIPAHSPRGPSGAETWMGCAGSVRMQEGREEAPSPYAAEGTFLHRIAALCLEIDLDPYSFVGRTAIVDGIEVEMEKVHARKMQAGIDRILEFPGKLFVEQRVSMEKWSEGDFGTLDIGVIGRREIVIADWKWGAGEIVEVVRNKQMMIYAMALWYYIARHMTDTERFRLIIMQPMIEGGEYSEWVVTLDELLAFGKEVRRAAALTRKPNAPLNPSVKACRWCKAFNDCPAAAAANLDMFGVSFPNLKAGVISGAEPKLKKIESLTPEERAYIVQHTAHLRRWLELLHADALAAALEGKGAGLKAINGRRGPRQYKDKKKVESLLKKWLGDEAYKKALKTPTQIEEDGDLSPAQWKQLQEFIGQSKGKPSLVPVSDRRAAITPNAIEFQDLRRSVTPSHRS